MNINKILINAFIKSTERAAYGASLFKGKGDKIAAITASGSATVNISWLEG